MLHLTPYTWVTAVSLSVNIIPSLPIHFLSFPLLNRIQQVLSLNLGWEFFIHSFKLQQSGRRQWHPTPVLLPGKSHGRRSLVGCSPWGRKESDPTERLHFHFSLSCTGEGNGNPLQCSCLENPRDGGAWWAAVCGVTWSQTQLKWLSSSSSSSGHWTGKVSFNSNPKERLCQRMFKLPYNCSHFTC